MKIKIEKLLVDPAEACSTAPSAGLTGDSALPEGSASQSARPLNLSGASPA